MSDRRETARAAELGSLELVVRLGGIYGLEGAMNGSPQYHQLVLEALCVFVRDGTISKEINRDKPASDIQAVLTVIGRRGPGLGTVDLAEVKIPGANLIGAIWMTPTRPAPR